MELVSTVFVFPILLLALGTIVIIAPIIGIEAPNHRYAAIDGLRGFLAMLVFLHHSAIWYYFARVHQWGVMVSNLFFHFGSTSVAFFFMITSFLFFTKLIDSYGGGFDWLKLYVSRVARIVPLYAFVVLALFIIVGFVTGFSLQESFGNLMLQLGQWLIIMDPDVNRLGGTRFIIASVQWSLAFEWLFYFSLAVFGCIFFRLKTSAMTLLLSIAFLVVFALIIYNYYPSEIGFRLLPFASGLLAAFAVRSESIRKLFSRAWASPFLLLLLCVALFYYSSIFSLVPLGCVTLVFIGIACGNDFFGLLTYKPCRLLGQISYSIYLLHGLVLFVAFYFAIGFDRAARLSVLGHWLTTCVCAVFVVVVCSFTYYYIERPGMKNGTVLTRRIRQLLGWKMSPI